MIQEQKKKKEKRRKEKEERVKRIKERKIKKKKRKKDENLWITISIDTGCYGLMNINKQIKRQLKEQGIPIAVEFKARYNNFKCTMIIQPQYAVN